MPQNLTDAEEVRLLDLSLANTDKLALLTQLATGEEGSAGTEVVGGSYARQTLAFAAAATTAGVTSKVTNAAVSFPAMPAVECQGYEVWSGDGSTRKWYGLWSPKNAAAAASSDVVTSTGHGMTDGTRIVFQPGFAPAGATAGTTFFVRDSTANTFKIAATSGGAAVDLTADAAQVVFGLVKVVNGGDPFAIASGALTFTLD